MCESDWPGHYPAILLVRVVWPCDGLVAECLLWLSRVIAIFELFFSFSVSQHSWSTLKHSWKYSSRFTSIINDRKNTEIMKIRTLVWITDKEQFTLRVALYPSLVCCVSSVIKCDTIWNHFEFINITWQKFSPPLLDKNPQRLWGSNDGLYGKCCLCGI